MMLMLKIAWELVDRFTCIRKLKGSWIWFGEEEVK